MTIGHFFDAGGYLDYDEASMLLPVEDLEAVVHTRRNAERVLQSTSSESVLAIRPTGLASSYALAQRPLAAIEVASLGDKPRGQLEGAAAIDLQEFEFIQIGRSTFASMNRSLTEFSDETDTS